MSVTTFIQSTETMKNINSNNLRGGGVNAIVTLMQVCKYICMHMHTCIHTLSHTHTHTRTHMDTHMDTCKHILRVENEHMKYAL